MIGHSKSGKTSYMAGLYKQYGDEQEGFGLWMSDTNKRERLEKLATNISRGQYPAGTDIARQYEFWLQYDNKLLIPFNWYDYRGGALSENSKNSPDAKKLISQINQADALIVFLDGKKIVNMTDDDLEEEYDVLFWAIQKSISQRSSNGHYFPISFIITKGDLYQSYEPLYNSPGFEYFMPIMKNISQSEVAAGMVGIVEVSKEGISNVFAPLIFSLYYGMHHYIEDRLSSLNAEIEYYNSLDPGFWDDLGSLLFGGESDSQKAEKSIEKIKEEKNRLETLDALSDVMGEMLAYFVDKNLIIKF